MEQPGIYLQEGFSAKIESRKLGVVAAMAGFLNWFDQDQTDEIEFLVAERDCNHLDMNKRFGRHKVCNIQTKIITKQKFTLLSSQGICVYLRPEDDFKTSCPYRAITIFDGIISNMVGEEKMERFLICPKCILKDKERYFGTSEGSVGLEFQIRNTMERCGPIVLEEEAVSETHSIRDTHQVMLKRVPRSTFSRDAFPQDLPDREALRRILFKEIPRTHRQGEI